MVAPLAVLGWLAAAGAVGLASSAIWGDDEEARQALEGEGEIDLDAVDWTNPPPEAVEAVNELPPDVQERVVANIQQQVSQQQPQGPAGDSSLGSLAGDLGAQGGQQPPAAPGQPTQPPGAAPPGGQAPPEPSGPSFEGHVFAEAPPSPSEAASRKPDGRLSQQFVSQGMTDEVSHVDLLQERVAATGDFESYASHTPSAQVLPYVRALHEWATAEGRSVEGLYRQRFYRQETLRLGRELDVRTTRTPNGRSLSTAEAHLRGWVRREGSLSPWESDTPLSFSEDELTGPADKVAGLVSELPADGGTSGGSMESRRGPAFRFAPFRELAGRDDLFAGTAGASIAQNALADLSQSGDWDSDVLAGIEEQNVSQFAQAQEAVFLRKRAPEFPDYENNADRVLRSLQGSDPNVDRLSSFSASPQAVIDQLHRLSEPEVTKLQTELWKAGFFGQEIPTRGFADGATVEAMTAAVTEAARFARAGEVVTVEDVIERRQERFAGRLGELASGARGLSQQTVQVALEDPAALAELIEQTAIQTIGAANLDEGQIQTFIGAIHQAQRQQAQQRVGQRNQALQQWQPETPWDEPPEELFGGGVVESVNVSPGARAEDFIEQARPAEAGATQFANTYGAFLDLIGGGGAR